MEFSASPVSHFPPYFAQQVLRDDATGYGILVSAPGVGAVVISFFLSTHGRVRGMRRLLFGASLICATAIFLFAICRIMPVALLLLVLVGAMQMSYQMLARAIIREEFPDYRLGRAKPFLSRSGLLAP